LLGQPGAISPGAEFTVDGAGDLHHANSVPSGTATKVTYDAQGHITGGTTLVPADIPNLDASKITTGALPTDRLADHSVTSIKLADYATAYIQDVQPANAGNTIGQLWLNPLAQQIRMWDGNVWVPIGVGALSEQNLRFCGLFTAVDGKITILTQFGRDAGYKVGDVLPVATDQLTGSYFVCDTAGNGVAVTPGVTYDPGDWCVCLGVAQGWERVDTLSGGGGGGTTTLDGLIDVDVPSPGAGQVLTYDGAVWKAGAIGNASIAGRGLIELATQAEVDAGIDAERAVTPATLKTYVASAAPTVPDATEAVKGIAQLADAGAVTAGLANRVVQASQLKTTNDTLATAVTNITNLQTSVTTLQGQTVDATTTVKGIVQLADAAAITAGTAGRVVTADQLKTTNDALATAVGGGVTTINGTAPITVTGTGNTRTVAVADATTAAKGVVQLADAVAITAGTAGRVVDAAQLKAFTPADASETVKGVIELATTAEVLTGTDTVRAVTPKGLKDNYLAKDISKLPALP
jgi:carbon monoxide dehydrogenase subunit G